jgi:hypothetical protein
MLRNLYGILKKIGQWRVLSKNAYFYNVNALIVHYAI